ncbi:thioredoxin-like protein [Mytilinidion resinicola]|uniref:Glutathione S-transferase kappa n=1 Tax=Mytilinidion resinicola TaxID=574789 RepID=A0A6A6Z4H3_9PEZI|nr:thioredoxin-like protein [Mytilinidion resinicola]KAF2815184.1 thioredoxin-like protein [Mytilinidion resinicola]
MPTGPTITYYFSFISLWSHIGSAHLHALAARHNARLIYKPINLPHIFSISGGLPVAQRSPQRQAYRLLEMERWRRIRGVPVTPHPRIYPADPSLAHRVLLAAIEEEGHDSGRVRAFAQRGLRLVWAEEGDVADAGTVARVAGECGLEGGRLVERAEGEGGLREQESKLTREAEEGRFFGAPVYVYRGEPLWGQDRLEMLEEVLGSGREAIALPVV